MRAGDLTQFPNPFAPDPPVSAHRRAVVSALKFLFVIAVLLTVLLTVTSHGPGWLASRLSSNFDSLDTQSKQARLIQMSQLGEPGVAPLTAAIADSDRIVAERAFELIQELQNQWTTLSKADADQRKLSMARSIGLLAERLPSERQVWAAELLQQTIVDTSEKTDDASRMIFAVANQSLQALNDPSIDPIEHGETTTLGMAGSSPLPLSSNDREATWTDWPPPQPMILKAGFSGAIDDHLAHAETTELNRDETTEPVVESPGTKLANESEPRPTVYRSGGLLTLPASNRLVDALPELTQRVNPIRQVNSTEPVPESQTSSLATNVQGAVETAYHQAAPREPDEVAWVSADTESVIRIMGSGDESVHEQAAAELTRRGFNETEVSIAGIVACDDVSKRLALIDELTANETVDPRPWLLLLLVDPDRQVKLDAITALSKTLDPLVRDHLRRRLSEESDQKVVFRIRRILDLR
ncbi:MAG: HEAT repeat domain-containing protein [Pirellulaceae bacterium]|nr:HEAT repeat domain-containing protein [Pirellulaceae bacterium]